MKLFFSVFQEKINTLIFFSLSVLGSLKVDHQENAFHAKSF